MQNPTRGRVYRRCACRDGSGDQLDSHCPKLGNRSHGRWSYAVDLAAVGGRRKTRRRGGFATKQEARAALAKILEYERTGLVIDDRQTVGDHLTEWMRTKALTLKPTTIANYQRYITQDLLPSLGHLRLDTLNHRHVMRFVHEQLTAGRGPTTIRRCVATLSSALHDAVRQRRLPHNAARYATVPRPPKYEPTCWTPTQAARFLRHCADHNDPLTDLFEVIIGTGMYVRHANAWDGPSVLLLKEAGFKSYRDLRGPGAGGAGAPPAGPAGAGARWSRVGGLTHALH